VRIGTNSAALRGLGPAEMPEAGALVRQVLAAVKPLGDREFELDPAVQSEVIGRVRELVRSFPVPRYPRRAPYGLDSEALAGFSDAAALNV
jgi:glycine hydroxymethyltransferase